MLPALLTQQKRVNTNSNDFILRWKTNQKTLLFEQSFLYSPYTWVGRLGVYAFKLWFSALIFSYIVLAVARE